MTTAATDLPGPANGVKVCMFVLNNCRHDSRVLKEAESLATAGYQVRILALQDRESPAAEERAGFRIQRIEVFDEHFQLNVKSTVARRLAMLPGKVFLRLARMCGVPLASLRFYRKSLRILRKDPAHIYHGHDLNALATAWGAARKTGGIAVYDSHELFLERNRVQRPGRVSKLLTTRLESFLIRRVAASITVNHTIAGELARRYGVPEPLVVMNAPSLRSPRCTTSPSMRQALGITADRRILVYCGAITFNRGLEKLIQALPLLPRCQLVLMGYGVAPYKESLAARAVAGGVGDRFSFFGPVPSEEVAAHLSHADVGVAPIQNACLSYYYCSPNKVFEYIAGGIPVAASNFPELRRVIEGYGIGRTFDPEDPSQIARAIREILTDPAEYARMKGNTARAAGDYNWEGESRKLVELYATLRPRLDASARSHGRS